MTPCEDLLGSWVLRILIWVVFLVILFTNGLVLIVIVASLKPFQRFGLSITDSEVSRFYFSQLAVADIGVCVYLGFLVVVDLKTFNKQEFYEMVLSWQYGTGCLIAGFVAILSFELTVYTLVIITLKRIYVYKFAVTETKMHMHNAILIILFGWVFAATCATLPLVDVNSYSTVAICLPFDVISTKGRSYITVLMNINLLAFITVIACNFYLCYRLRKISGITAYNSKMFRIIFALIVIDFLCWAPLITFSLAALFEHDLVDTSTAKWFVLLVLPINACINPFLYAPLTEKFKHLMQKIYHDAKKVLPKQHNRRNSVILGEFDQEHDSPVHDGSTSSSNVPILNHCVSLPRLDSDGSHNDSPRALLPTPLSNSMPELAISSESSNLIYVVKPMTKNKSTNTTIKAQAKESVDKQLETKNDVNVKEEPTKKSESIIINLDKISSMAHHNTDECSGTDSVQATDEDSHSITSLSVKAASTFNDDHYMISTKLNSPILVEETNV